MVEPILISSLDFEKGEVFLIDKPLTWTSFDVVRKVRNRLGIKKVGHAGTLDPLATGLLIVCAGKSTKRIDEYQGLPKTYTGTLVLGKTTPSVDLETEFDSEKDYSHVTEDQVIAAAKLQVGDLMQIPPIYSAIKVDGQRAYKAAREIWLCFTRAKGLCQRSGVRFRKGPSERSCRHPFKLSSA